jgi:site-specific DNA recombinase
LPIPPVVDAGLFERVRRRLAANQQGARRSTAHPYLLRGLVSCGLCRLARTGRARRAGEPRYTYYLRVV